MARKPITLLHVSDMQFGVNHRFDGDSLFTRLSDDISTLEDAGVQPDLIVASGDLAEWGMKTEFEDALSFLTKLSERLKIPRQRVIIVPGNHDVNRKLCEAYFLKCEGEGTQPVKPYWPKWESYQRFFQQFYESIPNISFTVDTPFTWWEFPELELAVAGINSTMAESHHDDDHYGCAGEDQYRKFSERLKVAKANGWFCIGVVHHNVQRGAENDHENLRDADDLNRILGPRLDLLLHGHTHNSKTGWLRQNIPILSTGSAAVKAEARPEEVPNQYQAIRIDHDGFERWTRCYSPTQKRWIADTSCSEDGNQWHSSEPIAFWPDEVRRRVIKREEPPGREPSERRDDFLSRVAEVCRLKCKSVEEVRQERPALDYIKVGFAEGSVTRVGPIGIAESGVSAELVGRYDSDVFARYRAADAFVQCELVYGGEPAPDDLIRSTRAKGIRLASFTEFQGLIDFRRYLERQTQRLETDVIYPPSLYVTQKLRHEIGRDSRDYPDACAQVMEWLQEPSARFVLVLGEFGNGKTFLLHELARRMPKETPALVPMVVELRSLEKAGTFEQLIAQHLAAAGERFIDLESFRYMLKAGRVALLFDGFDELAQRVHYQQAAEHLQTLIQAAEGRAKVVVTSRTQHFESAQQVKTALFERTQSLAGLQLVHVQPFDEDEILRYLENLLKDREAAMRRFQLIQDIRDLLGLSHNPRMLGFIANLPEEDLREAQERTGRITAAALYRLLLERWLGHEYERTQPRGAAPNLTVEERWAAVTSVALHLWAKLDRTISLSELEQQVARSIDKLTERRLDAGTATHLVGSGTLLVRDEADRFAFVHQSVMEWLVAKHAAMGVGLAGFDALASREMSPLMVDFFCDLAPEDEAIAWARRQLSASGNVESPGKTNALLVLGRMGFEINLSATEPAGDLHGQNLRGKDFSSQWRMPRANFRTADLTEARLEGMSLVDADFTSAVLDRTNFVRANLTGANLSGSRGTGVRLLGANLTGAMAAGAKFRRAKLTGAQVSVDTLANCDTFGAAMPSDLDVKPLLSAPPSACNAVAFGSADLIATGHDDGTVRLWDAASGKGLETLRGHEARVWSVAFSADGQRLASGSADKTVRLWDAASGKGLETLRGHEARVWSVAFSADGQRLASGSDDQTVRLWDAASGKGLETLRGHEASVLSVAFSADGQRLASGSADQTVRLWDAASGKGLETLRGHEASVWSVAFSADGQRLASGSADKTVRLWDAASGKGLETLRGHEASVWSVAFSADGQRLASGSDDKTVRLWDAASGKGLETLRGHEARVWSVAFSADGQRLASGSADQTVRLWDAASGKGLETLRGHEARVWSVAFSADGQRLASGSDDQTVRLWDAASGKGLETLRGHEASVLSVAFSADGQRLASGSADQTVRLWDAASGKGLETLRGHEASVWSVAFSADGQRLASGSADQTVRLWDAASGKGLETLRGHEASVRSVAFSADGQRLASGSADKTVRLWDAASGKGLETLRGHEASVWSVAFSADGQRLASGSDDKTVRLWDAASGKGLETLRGHEARVWSVAFSADGQRLASGSADQTVRLWDAASGKGLETLRGHEASVRSVAFSADGQRLASGSDDQTVRLWDAASGALLATFVAAEQGWVVFTPDGRYRVNGNLGGVFAYRIGLCRFEPGELDPFLPPGVLREMAPEEKIFSVGITTPKQPTRFRVSAFKAWSLRAEGLSELVGPIVISFMGPIDPNLKADIRLTFNTNVTSRIIQHDVTEVVCRAPVLSGTGPLATGLAGRRADDTTVHFSNVPIGLLAQVEEEARTLEFTGIRLALAGGHAHSLSVFAWVFGLGGESDTAVVGMRSGRLTVRIGPARLPHRADKIPVRAAQSENLGMTRGEDGVLHAFVSFGGQLLTEAGTHGTEDGTRLRIVFNNVPESIQVFVTTGPVERSELDAFLVSANSFGKGGDRAVGTAYATCEVGRFPVAPVRTSEGYGSCTWLIEGAARSYQARLTFGVALVCDASREIPDVTRVSLNCSFAPVATGTGTNTMSPTQPIPRFADQSTSAAPFTLAT